MNPRFWTPANAMGVAATLEHEVDNKHVLINFYWPGMEFIANPQTRQDLVDQINTCLTEHPMTNPNDHTIFYLQRSGDDFVEIQTDPGWAPRA